LDILYISKYKEKYLVTICLRGMQSSKEYICKLFQSFAAGFSTAVTATRNRFSFVRFTLLSDYPVLFLAATYLADK